MLSVKECDETASLFREAYLDSYTATLRVGIERALRQARALAVLAELSKRPQSSQVWSGADDEDLVTAIEKAEAAEADGLPWGTPVAYVPREKPIRPPPSPKRGALRATGRRPSAGGEK